MALDYCQWKIFRKPIFCKKVNSQIVAGGKSFFWGAGGGWDAENSLKPKYLFQAVLPPGWRSLYFPQLSWWNSKIQRNVVKPELKSSSREVLRHSRSRRGLDLKKITAMQQKPDGNETESVFAFCFVFPFCGLSGNSGSQRNQTQGAPCEYPSVRIFWISLGAVRQSRNV